MTKVVYESYYDTHILECTGHTEYSEGDDILCSAVSTLCYTLRQYLTDAASEGKISELKCSFDKAFFMISFRCTEDSPVCEGVSAILCGFGMLEASFPQHISFDA